MGEPVEPTVTIRREEGAEIEEYSVNGRIYAVKVTPAVGPPYYFYDTDGDGDFDVEGDPTELPEINRWTLLSW